MKKLFIGAMAVLMLGLTAAYAADTFSNKQKDEIKNVVREYLVKNPEVIAEALQELQKREYEKRVSAKKKLIKENTAKLAADNTDPFLGNPKAKATVVEFFDYNCGYCRRALPVVTRLLKENKNVKYVFKELPILSEGSKVGSEVAIAIWKKHPDKYKEYHWGLMQNGRRTNEAVVKQQVEKLGLKWDEIRKFSKSAEVQTKVEGNRKLAQQLGIDGTPSFVVGDNFYPGLVSYDVLKKAIEAL